jgi:hypothetical protein
MAPRAVPRYTTINIPRQFRELAERRTQFLRQVLFVGDTSMRAVLASAWLQGVTDASDALRHKAGREIESPPEPRVVPWQC